MAAHVAPLTCFMLQGRVLVDEGPACQHGVGIKVVDSHVFLRQPRRVSAASIAAAAATLPQPLGGSDGVQQQASGAVTAQPRRVVVRLVVRERPARGVSTVYYQDCGGSSMFLCRRP